MLRLESDIKGYAIAASDGEIGAVKDFFFDDAAWRVRWLVIDTGSWLAGRQVLLPPVAVTEIDRTGHRLSVAMTRQHIKECPEVASDPPVSRQMEANIFRYYGWAPYWGEGSYLGVVGYGGGMAGVAGDTRPSAELMEREHAIDEEQRRLGDPGLRSANEVIGYHIRASDGEIGHVEDILFDETDWRIGYLIVNTLNWWPGKKVLISPDMVRAIDWSKRIVSVAPDRQTIKAAPPYDSSAVIDADYEKNFQSHYGALRLATES